MYHSVVVIFPVLFSFVVLISPELSQAAKCVEKKKLLNSMVLEKNKKKWMNETIVPLINGERDLIDVVTPFFFWEKGVGNSGHFRFTGSNDHSV